MYEEHIQKVIDGYIETLSTVPPVVDELWKEQELVLAHIDLLRATYVMSQAQTIDESTREFTQQMIGWLSDIKTHITKQTGILTMIAGAAKMIDAVRKEYEETSEDNA